MRLPATPRAHAVCCLQARGLAIQCISATSCGTRAAYTYKMAHGQCREVGRARKGVMQAGWQGRPKVAQGGWQRLGAVLASGAPAEQAMKYRPLVHFSQVQVPPVCGGTLCAQLHNQLLLVTTSICIHT